MIDHIHRGDEDDQNLCVWTEPDGERCMFPLNEEGLYIRTEWVRADESRRLAREGWITPTQYAADIEQAKDYARIDEQERIVNALSDKLTMYHKRIDEDGCISVVVHDDTRVKADAAAIARRTYDRSKV